MGVSRMPHRTPKRNAQPRVSVAPNKSVRGAVDARPRGAKVVVDDAPWFTSKARTRLWHMLVEVPRKFMEGVHLIRALLRVTDTNQGDPNARFRLVWKYLPRTAQLSTLGLKFGRIIYRRSRMHQPREACTYTRFLRLGPQLDVARQIALHFPPSASIRLTVLGCSTGAELYSFVWTLRSARPDLTVRPVGVDISSSAIDTARHAVYPSRAPELQGISEHELDSLFIRCGESVQVRPWVSQGVSWIIADACDPKLVEILGPHDIVVANNFLIHMFPPHDETTLRNIVKLLQPGGYLFAHGIDIDVRTRVARELGLVPVPLRIEQQHNEMDPEKLNQWPWHWCGREPLDRRVRDWELRYSTIFQLPRPGSNSKCPSLPKGRGLVSRRSRRAPPDW